MYNTQSWKERDGLCPADGQCENSRRQGYLKTRLMSVSVLLPQATLVLRLFAKYSGWIELFLICALCRLQLCRCSCLIINDEYSSDCFSIHIFSTMETFWYVFNKVRLTYQTVLQNNTQKYILSPCCFVNMVKAGLARWLAPKDEAFSTSLNCDPLKFWCLCEMGRVWPALRQQSGFSGSRTRKMDGVQEL